MVLTEEKVQIIKVTDDMVTFSFVESKKGCGPSCFCFFLENQLIIYPKKKLYWYVPCQEKAYVLLKWKSSSEYHSKLWFVYVYSLLNAFGGAYFFSYITNDPFLEASGMLLGIGIGICFLRIFLNISSDSIRVYVLPFQKEIGTINSHNL